LEETNNNKNVKKLEIENPRICLLSYHPSQAPREVFWGAEALSCVLWTFPQSRAKEKKPRIAFSKGLCVLWGRRSPPSRKKKLCGLSWPNGNKFLDLKLHIQE
jgi:hypothetical protein